MVVVVAVVVVDTVALRRRGQPKEANRGVTEEIRANLSRGQMATACALLHRSTNVKMIALPQHSGASG